MDVLLRRGQRAEGLVGPFRRERRDEVVIRGRWVAEEVVDGFVEGIRAGGEGRRGEGRGVWFPKVGGAGCAVALVGLQGSYGRDRGGREADLGFSQQPVLWDGRDGGSALGGRGAVSDRVPERGLRAVGRPERTPALEGGPRGLPLDLPVSGLVVDFHDGAVEAEGVG